MSRSRRRIAWRVLLGVLVVGLVWLARDLWGSTRSNLRAFDPVAVAHSETAMWRAYYAKQPWPLYHEMVQLLRTQYHLPPARAQIVGADAARAAFLFKRGRDRADYEKALPALRSYYGAIRRASTTPFDVDRAARLELEWWIVHRERRRHDPSDLPRALANLQATIYDVPVEALTLHGQTRADAMTIRDDDALRGPVPEQDWAQIDSLLVVSWTALRDAVNR